MKIFLKDGDIFQQYSNTENIMGKFKVAHYSNYKNYFSSRKVIIWVKYAKQYIIIPLHLFRESYSVSLMFLRVTKIGNYRKPTRSLFF